MRKLKKCHCRELANTITTNELMDMIIKAKDNIINWEAPSRSNKSLSRGYHWNLFCKDFNIEGKYTELYKFRMLEEYGEYLEVKFITKGKQDITVMHREPDFSNFK